MKLDSRKDPFDCEDMLQKIQGGNLSGLPIEVTLIRKIKMIHIKNLKAWKSQN